MHRVTQRDVFHEPGLLVHVAVLAQLRMRTALFGLAHRIADAMPTRAVAWYAIGTYYLILDDVDKARVQLR